ncbi:hypothetical protein [Cupriavidus sp. DL-D2]|uniref:hypothetical protein n=1 Tax=Cupriavidus sp. DL-D2 TaxID=3144974 RepID=UPI003213A638
MAKRKTNIEAVVDLMSFSQYGVLAQLFVIDALVKVADRAAKADPATLDSPMLSGKAWVGVAKEIQFKLNQHLNQQ